LPAITQPSATASATVTATNTTGVANKTIADNFQTFLTLLTTQLKNQNPLDPLDTNQFTQQLVQFAQVEQQLKQNDQLATLISITGKDASGQVVAIPSEVEGVVDSVDLTQTPPVLSIGTQTFTLDKIKRVVRQ